MAEYSGADIVIQALLRNGVDTVFGYPGGAIMPLYDALYHAPIQHILTRHEQAAVHAAEGYARASGKTGVCIATSGPGATNLVTGIADAWMDSIPLVAITGQVASHLIGTDAFQETNVVGVTAAITKQTLQPRTVNEVSAAIAEAFYLANSGRPGPVVIDLPKDVLSKQTNLPIVTESDLYIPGYCCRPQLDPVDVYAGLELLRAAQRPLIVVGGGCKMSGPATLEMFRELCRLTNIPVTATVHGLGSTPPNYPYYLGMLGMHGLKRANKAVTNCDLLIALGMRFDDRVTGAPDRFARQAKIVHVEIDPAEVNKLIKADVGIIGDLGDVLAMWLQDLAQTPYHTTKSWQEKVFAPGDGLKMPAAVEAAQVPPTLVLDELFQLLPSNTIVTTDVGQHQMWAAQRARPNDPRRFITSGGLGAMGFGIPSALGAQLACPNQLVVAIVGDGGFQMSVAELTTIKRHNLPVKILVMDNKYLGMVRQWQEMFYQGRYSAVDMRDNPDFAKIATAYGIASFKLNDATAINDSIRAWLATSGPALLHCECHLTANVFPMIPSGAAIDEMIEAASTTNG
ncbi:MAG: biosynthetic-type acetolactate synthase large subunit [Acidobacteriota bacterium]